MGLLGRCLPVVCEDDDPKNLGFVVRGATVVDFCVLKIHLIVLNNIE